MNRITELRIEISHGYEGCMNTEEATKIDKLVELVASLSKAKDSLEGLPIPKEVKRAIDESLLSAMGHEKAGWMHLEYSIESENKDTHLIYAKAHFKKSKSLLMAPYKGIYASRMEL